MGRGRGAGGRGPGGARGLSRHPPCPAPAQSRPEPPGSGPGVRHAITRGALVCRARHLAGTPSLAWAGRLLVHLPLGRGGPAALRGWGVGRRPWSQPGGPPDHLIPDTPPRITPPSLPACWSFWPGRPHWASGAHVSRRAPRGAHCGTVNGVRWERWASDSEAIGLCKSETVCRKPACLGQ